MCLVAAPHRVRAYSVGGSCSSSFFFQKSKVSEEIREGTKCHFDYMALLVASSAISAMGLATNNVAVVVAAMLVSGLLL